MPQTRLHFNGNGCAIVHIYYHKNNVNVLVYLVGSMVLRQLFAGNCYNNHEPNDSKNFFRGISSLSLVDSTIDTFNLLWSTWLGLPGQRLLKIFYRTDFNNSTS